MEAPHTIVIFPMRAIPIGLRFRVDAALRERMGREASPSVAVLDGQPVKSVERGGGKEVFGRR